MFYAFILGKNTALSVAEILSVLKRESFVFVSLSISGKALIFKTDKKIKKPQDFLDKLGGTVKIAEIISSVPRGEVKNLILNFIENNFKNQKFIFGISSFNEIFPKLGFEIKNELKKVGVNSRFVIGKDKTLSAPEIKNNKILTNGADFVLIYDNHQVFIGKTIAIQDYESYSHRDYNRPRRNAKSGMLPPKIAQIMINLIPSSKGFNKSKNLIIYDPFCGQGTVIQEALLMGHQVMGSDISKERIYDTKENLKWIAQEYGLKIEIEKIVFQADALNLAEKELPANPDVIISEVYLGPPLTVKENEKEISQLIIDLEGQYKLFLNNIRHLNIRSLVLALPFYKIKNKVNFLNIIDEIRSIGYNIIDPFNNTGIGLDLVPEYNKFPTSLRSGFYPRSSFACPISS